MSAIIYKDSSYIYNYVLPIYSDHHTAYGTCPKTVFLNSDEMTVTLQMLAPGRALS